MTVNSTCSNSTIYAIHGPEDISTAKFQLLCLEYVDDVIDDPHAHIYLTDFPGCGTWLSRYLKVQYYRNATLFHVGEDPRHNLASFSTRGGFSSKEKCLETMKREADVFILLE